ncbi:phosphatidylinositol transfer protein 3 [Cocos nucifera]|nr:phosphatidylinositol transfer protein 3 [Cocos nucifera]
MDPQGYGDLSGSDDNERKKVDLLRSLVKRQDSAAKEVDNLMLRRFLRARDLDIEKASSMFLKYLKWRREAVPNGFISEAEIQNELIQKKIFMQGFDKMGQPILVSLAARHYHSKRDMDEFKRFMVYVLDNLCARVPSSHEKFIAIVDLQGWGYSNCDVRAYIAALEIMQFIFVEDKNLKATLLEDIDESQLPEIYGGKLPLVSIEDSAK